MEETLKHELLRSNVFLWLAIQRLGGELAVSREEYLELKKVGVLIGQDELMQNVYKGAFRILFNMGDLVTVHIVPQTTRSTIPHSELNE